MIPPSGEIRRSAAALVAALALLCAAHGAAAEAQKAGYLVIAPKSSLTTLKPLLELRRSEYDVSVVTVEELTGEAENLTPDVIKRSIRARHTETRPLSYLLLVGDTHAGEDDMPAIPTHPQGFDVWYGTLATDDPRGPPLSIHRPDIAVGRFPASTREELKSMVQKTVSYERQRRPGPWQRRIHIITSAPNYNPQLDALIEGVTTTILSTAVPQTYDLTMTQGRTSSPYCYPPDEFEKRVIELFNGGALYVAYVGHGTARSAMKVTGFMRGKIMDCATVRHIQCPSTSRPIAFFLACHMGQFDRRADSLAEAMVKAPGGPVACVASTRRSHPYGNTVFGLELVRALLGGRPSTLGRGVLDAQRRLTNPIGTFDLLRKGVDRLAPMSDTQRRAALIAHVYLYNLLGDPALRVAYPSRPIPPFRAAIAPDGTHWKIEASLNGMKRGRAIVTLEVHRTVIRGAIEKVSPQDAGWRATMKRNYDTANRKVVTQIRLKVEDGRVHATIPTASGGRPLSAGPYLIKVFAWNEQESAAGATHVVWTPPAEKQRHPSRQGMKHSASHKDVN